MERNGATGLHIFGLAVATAAGTILVCLVATGFFKGKSLWDEKAARWASALTTFAAVCVALHATQHGRRLRDEEWAREERETHENDLRQALLVAAPLNEELSALRYNVGALIKYAGMTTFSSELSVEFRNFYNALETPVFNLLSMQLEYVDLATSSAVVMAYAKLHRVKTEIDRRLEQCSPLSAAEFMAARLSGELAVELLPLFETAHRSVHAEVTRKGSELVLIEAKRATRTC